MWMAEGQGDSAVAELQGLDGAFSFAESVLQRVWDRGDFDREHCRCEDGRHLRILSPGRWNRLGGPDFSRAIVEIDGRRVEGDVELHLKAADWKTHGHADDPRYRDVVLHVVLFPPAEKFTLGYARTPLPIFALWPRLHRSLEEYAEEEAVERLAAHPLAKAREAWAALSQEEQACALAEGSAMRWQQKLRGARERLARFGWSDACHRTALEILGYRFNRGPMLAIAARFPLEKWPAVGAEDNLGVLLSEDSWHLQAIRPANQPKTRLRQYAAWTARVTDWPNVLRAELSAFKLEDHLRSLSTRDFRRARKTGRVFSHLSAAICGQSIPGTRFLTLMCDGFFPLLAADQTAFADDLGTWWRHAQVGDAPETIARILKVTGHAGSADQPLSHGLVQGYFAWCWREEEKRTASAAYS